MNEAGATREDGNPHLFIGGKKGQGTRKERDTIVGRRQAAVAGDHTLCAMQPAEPHHQAGAFQSGERPAGSDSCTATNDARVARSYSITPSASSLIGKVSPSAWAVFKLIISSIFVDCWIGRSAGFAPLRIWPV